jgi:putative radical SAM enzyme (TIGR03279 family)
MPKGMRESLYVKDDDYRQSFLCGNFVTLTNVTDDEIERIIRLKLSPLYVSVQATNGELRKKMLNNRFADKIISQLERLSAGGIDIHAQIVLVKGLNDGKELDDSINTLYSIKGIKSVAVVPCGITRFREGLYPIEDIDSEYALGVINQVERLNNAHNANLVALADEFYFKAGVSLPPYESYGDFWQIENGVGMSAKFERDIKEIIELNEKPLLAPGRYLTVCGTSVYDFMSKVIKKVEGACKGVEIKLVAVKNDFFGHTVNCTVLLTGGDIVNALKEYAGQYDALLVPNPCLMQFADLFLDGMNFEQLESALKMKIIRARVN